MSLETPIKIRMLQRKLYQKAKEEPSYRFYLLYDKMYREDVLAHAYALVKSNQGAPGVDGQSFWGIESQGLEEWLSGIREDLRAKTYRPQAVRRVMNPKPGGGERRFAAKQIYTLRRSNLRSLTCSCFPAPRRDLLGPFLPWAFAPLRRRLESRLGRRKKELAPLPPLRSLNQSSKRSGNPST